MSLRSDAPDTPRTLGRWTLLERLGAGGMGEVWRARDAAGLVAAVKIQHGPGLTPNARRRFQSEAEALARLEHPNVVRAMGFGETPDGALFLAMELLEGETLEARLRRVHALSPADAARIGQGAAAGLAAAHANGLVHRDVKPGNLFLCADGRIKVLDFGIAVNAPDPESEPATRLTGWGQIVGTVSYMAPEQAAASYAEDARTDVWALGAVLYHAVAGHPPFRTPSKSPVAELIRVMTQPFDPLPPGVPDLLSGVIARALAKEPGQRFRDMREMGAALEAVAHDATVGDSAVAAAVEVEGAAFEPTMASAEHDTVVTAPLIEEVRLVAILLAEGVHDGDALRELVRRHGGTAAALRGGRAVGVFGGAEWVGDEPARAARAALAGRAFAHTLALGTGKAVTGGGATDLLGSALEGAEAALLVARANGAAVGACPETQRRLHDSFVLEDGAIQRERSDDPELATSTTGTGDVPMVGRDLELARLQAVLDRAADESRAQVALVIGPPGIGKSRLRRALRQSVATTGRWRWLEGRGESIRAQGSFATITSVLRDAAGLATGAAAGDAPARLVASAGLAGDSAAETAAVVADLLDLRPEGAAAQAHALDPQALGDRIRLAVGALFDAWSRAHPLAIVVEDLQWADGASLALFDFLLTRLAGRKLVFIATARPELLADRPDVLPAAERIALRELGARDVGAIVERIAGHASPDIVERAAGNPLFAEELARAVHEGADPTVLPLTVEGAVQARLDRLSFPEKDLLKRASVLGRSFWVEGLVALGEPEAPRLLATLRRREICIPSGDARLRDCAEWSFRHAIVRDVAYGLLTAGQRQALHRAAASWLAARDDAPPEEVAAHHEGAGDATAAQPFWVQASLEANRLGDSERVIDHSTRALAAPHPLAPQVEYELRMHRFQSFALMGRPADDERELDALDAFIAAAGAAISLPDRSAVRRRRGEHAARRGRSADGLRAAEEALALARAARDPASEALALSVLSEQRTVAGGATDTLELSNEAVRLAELSGDSWAIAICSGGRATVLGLAGRLEASLAGYRRSQEAHRTAGRIRSVALTGNNMAWILLVLGDWEGAALVIDECLASTRALGLRLVEGFILHNRGILLARTGDPVAGKADEEAAIQIAREIGHTRLQAVGQVWRSEMCRLAGDPEGALESAGDAIASAQRLGVPLEAIARGMRASALLALGRPGEALEEVDRAEAAHPSQRYGLSETEQDRLLVRHDALVALGRHTEAAEALALAVASFEKVLAGIEDPRFRATFARAPSNARILVLRGMHPARETGGG